MVKFPSIADPEAGATAVIHGALLAAVRAIGADVIIACALSTIRRGL